jgi:hypothetical protein
MNISGGQRANVNVASPVLNTLSSKSIPRQSSIWSNNVPVKQEEVLGSIDTEIRHLPEAAQLPALSSYSPQLRRDAQKEEPVAEVRIVRVTIVLLQKSKYAPGDGGGEIARILVCYDAAAGPCDLPPGSLMLAQPLESLGRSCLIGDCR